MKTMKFKRTMLFLSLFLSFASNAQQDNHPKEKIAACISKYFELDRENIHVHFDKTLFFTNESVWFKGYVFNRKAGLPFYNTTNVHMQLIDPSGVVVSTQVLYVINGLFSGKVQLDPKFSSGYYYLQFYTNWMNNFNEDESFVQRIKIINPNDTSVPVADLLNKSKITLAFFPEGGTLINGVSNNVGVIVTDMNGTPIPNSSFSVTDSANQTIRTVTTNPEGMGKFEITPDGKAYTAHVSYNNKVWEYLLPASREGIALEVNNYTMNGKTLLKVKASAEYFRQNKGKPLYIVIQQDEKFNMMEITLDTEANKEIAFANDHLFKGVNTIRIIDAGMNQLAERYIFENTGHDSRLSIGVGFKNEDKIDFSGNSNSFNACMSIAVVPGNSKLQTKDNMLTNLYLNPYLKEKTTAQRENFNNPNRNKKFEMDLLALNQSQNKYSWEAIKSGPPPAKHEFESGIQIKGTINMPSGGLKRYKVELRNNFNEILGRSEVNEKNEFYFKDTNVTDSLQVYCDLIHMDNLTKKEMGYHLMVTNKNKRFNKTYIPAPFTFPDDNQNIAINNEIPKFDNQTIYLDEVEVNKKKNSLRRQNQSGNSHLRGTKISEHRFENMFVLDFIQSNGFYVSNYLGNVIISAKIPTSLNATPQTVPLIFIDGRQLMSFDELNGMRMEELDEIYLSTTAIVASINNNNGIIKMYRKYPDFRQTAKTKPSTIIGGFEPITSFSNADYLSVYTTGFENFGIINWVPWVMTDNSGNLKISIDNKKYKKVKLLIEGFTIDGRLISEIRELNLEE